MKYLVKTRITIVKLRTVEGVEASGPQEAFELAKRGEGRLVDDDKLEDRDEQLISAIVSPEKGFE